MRIKNLFIILFLCYTSICFSQNRLFEKFAELDDVTSVVISKKMFEMMPNVETGHLNLKNIKNKIHELVILTTENSSEKERMKKELNQLMGTTYEKLMQIKEQGSHVSFYVLEKREWIHELIMLVDEETEFVAIQLKGQFTLKDIQQITEDIQL